MSGVGESLRAAREAQGLGLEEVEDRLKIRRRFLVAIEAEQWDVLPGSAYARGFVRSYAQLLGLDGEELVGRYIEQRHEPDPDSVEMEINGGRLAVAPPGPRPGRRLGRPPWGLLAALAALVTAAVVIVLLVSGGGSSEPAGTGGDRAPAQPQAPATDTTEPSPPPAPAGAKVKLTATGTVWACVVDERGKVILDGVTLSPGEKQGPFRAKRLEMNFGNGLIDLVANGDPVPIPDPANPVGFVVTESKVSDLAVGERPTCAS